MRAQLQVIKADASIESYLHTKVIGTINNSLSAVGSSDVYAAQQLAEAVTYHLYNVNQDRKVSSSTILSTIKAVLAETGNEEAAMALGDYYRQREIKRSRIEVVPIDILCLDDAQKLYKPEVLDARSRWDKSKIVAYLIKDQAFDSQSARVVAAMVEEKILGMGTTMVSSGLIKKLVFREAAAVRRAGEHFNLI